MLGTRMGCSEFLYLSIIPPVQSALLLDRYPLCSHYAVELLYQAFREICVSVSNPSLIISSTVSMRRQQFFLLSWLQSSSPWLLDESPIQKLRRRYIISDWRYYGANIPTSALWIIVLTLLLIFRDALVKNEICCLDHETRSQNK